MQCASGVSDALCVIAAGVRDDSALSLLIREGCDFVMGSTQFEGADRLLVFGLEQEPARIGVAEWKFNQLCMDGHASNAGLGSLQIGESDHRFSGACRHRANRKAFRRR
jgi:hypothetical protein